MKLQTIDCNCFSENTYTLPLFFQTTIYCFHYYIVLCFHNIGSMSGELNPNSCGLQACGAFKSFWYMYSMHLASCLKACNKLHAVETCGNHGNRWLCAFHSFIGMFFFLFEQVIEIMLYAGRCGFITVLFLC